MASESRTAATQLFGVVINELQNCLRFGMMIMSTETKVEGLHLRNMAAAKQVPRTRAALISAAPHELSSLRISSFAFCSTTRSAFASSGLERNSKECAAVSIPGKAPATTPFEPALRQRVRRYTLAKFNKKNFTTTAPVMPATA